MSVKRLLTAGLKVIFQKAYNAYTPIYPSLTTRVESNGASEEYCWLGQTPALRKWIDERAPKSIRDFGFTVKNIHYESSIGVDRDEVQDDRYGQVNIRVKQMANKASKGYDDEFAALIESNPICYDGQNFFDTDHAESGTNQSNLFTTKPLTADNLESVLVAMSQIKGEDGQLFGTSMSHIVVPSALKYTAKKLLDPATVGVTNDPAEARLKGELDIVVLPTLTSSTTYYLIDANQGVMPFIFQERQPMQFNALDSDDDAEAFMRKTYYYGVDARFAFAVGDWKTAAKCTA